MLPGITFFDVLCAYRFKARSLHVYVIIQCAVFPPFFVCCVFLLFVVTSKRHVLSKLWCILDCRRSSNRWVPVNTLPGVFPAGVSRASISACRPGQLLTEPSPVLPVTVMDVFENCSVFLDLKNVPYKEKKRLRSAVTEHGGSLCLLVNKQVTQ